MALGAKTSNRSGELRIQAAIHDYRAKRFTNIRDAATAHGITYGQLRGRLAGRPSRSEAHVEQQNLTKTEEGVIVAWILRLDTWGFPPHLKYVRGLATHFLRSHGIRNVDLGKNWVTRFLKRNPILETRFAVRLDKQRGFANNPDIIQDFFKKVFSLYLTISQYSI